MRTQQENTSASQESEFLTPVVVCLSTCLWQAWASTTKDCRLGGLSNRDVFVTILEAVKSKINVLADWLLVRDSSVKWGFEADPGRAPHSSVWPAEHM